MSVIVQFFFTPRSLCAMRKDARACRMPGRAFAGSLRAVLLPVLMLGALAAMLLLPSASIAAQTVNEEEYAYEQPEPAANRAYERASRPQARPLGFPGAEASRSAGVESEWNPMPTARSVTVHDNPGVPNIGVTGVTQPAPVPPPPGKPRMKPEISVAWGGYFEALAILCFALAFVLGALWIFKKVFRSGGPVSSARDMRIESRFALGPKKWLFAVRVGEKRMLLGVTEQNVNFLTDLPAPEEIPGASAEAGSSIQGLKKNPFSALLNKTKEAL